MTMTTDELRALAEGQDKETLIEFLVEEMKAGTSVDVHLHIAFSDDWFDEDRYASKQRWMALVLANSITVDEDGERVLNTFAERALADFYQEVAIATAFGRLKEAVALLLIADEEISALVDYGVDPIPLQEEVDDRFLAITDIAVGKQRTELFQHLLESRLPGEYPLRLALRLADTDEQRRALRARVEHDPDGEEIAFELLLIDGEREQQEAFLFERDVSPIRWARAAIDALESKEWERVLSYCTEGEKRFTSWSVWDQLRLKAHIGSGDRKEARALAFTMVVEERLEYQILETLVPDEEWDETVEQVRLRMEEQGKTCAPMLAAAEKYEHLLLQVQQHLHLIDEHWLDLRDEYPEQTMLLLTRRCAEMVDSKSSRKECAQLAKLLGVLKRIGGRVEAEDIIDDLLELYPKKRMLKEELRRAGLIE
jgi:hypothetical protein